MPELGVTGLSEYGGVITDDFLREWRLPQSYKRADEMRRNSPVIGALLASIELAVRKVEWTLTSENENDPRVELWDTMTRKLEGGWGNFIAEALSCLPFGFSLFEIVWVRRDNLVVPGKLAPRGQDTVYRWLMDDTGKLDGFVQVAAPLYKRIEIPIEKVVHFKLKAERGNPEGRSILRTAWVPYYFAKNIMQIESVGIERDLAGMPVIKLPMGATTGTEATSDSSKAAKMVRNIRRDEQEGIVLPNGWELTLLSTGGSRQFDTDKIITRYESRILMSALAQFLMLGQNATGSYSLSKDQTDLFNMAVNSIADTIGQALEDQLLPRLMRMNGYDAEGLDLGHSPAGDTDILFLAEFLSKLKDFVTWTVQDELWLREVANMPQVSEDELEAEREVKRAQTDAIIQAQQQRQAQPEQEEEDVPEDDVEDAEEEDPDKMGADFFGATDAVKRYERKQQRAVMGYFGQLRARLLKAARKASNA